jgi:hypothetical protein
MATGTYESNYKFLFLFIIISATIESGTKVGLIIAGLSAGVILGVDLISAPPETIINTYFESDTVLAAAFIIIAWTIGFM